MENKVNVNYIKSKGITLISLIITVIILLILSGVTLHFILSKNGIIDKATDAVNGHRKVVAMEQIELLLEEYNIQYYEEKNIQVDEQKNKKEYIIDKLEQQELLDEIRIEVQGDDLNIYDIQENLLVTGKFQENGQIKWNNDISENEQTTAIKERKYIIKDGVEQFPNTTDLKRAIITQENDYLKLTLSSVYNARAGYSTAFDASKYSKIFLDMEISIVEAANNGTRIMIPWSSIEEDVFDNNDIPIFIVSNGSGNTSINRAIFNITKPEGLKESRIYIISNATASPTTHIFKIYNLWLEK